jgi:hypothetical protein
MSTNVQYLPYDNTRQANFTAWGQGPGTALAAFGWTKDTTVNGTVNWGTIVNNPTTNGLVSSLPAQATTVFRGAFTPALNLTSVANAAGGSTVYTGTITGGGSNAFAGASFSVAGFTTGANNGTFTCTASTGSTLTLSNASGVSETHAATASPVYASGIDYVTSNGATWICNSSFTAGTTQVRPEFELNDGTTPRWVLWAFEIWKSAVTPTIFLKIEYSGITSVTSTPRIRISVGTSDDTNANVGSGSNQQSISADLAPTNLGTRDGMILNCYFSGDSGNRFAMLMWFGIDAFGGNGTGFFCVERSLANTGAYYTTPSGAVTPYWTVIYAGYNQTQSIQSIINTTGSIWIKNTSDTSISTLGMDLNGSLNLAPNLGVGAGAGNASSPAFPIWPLVGWVGNPLTAVMSFKVASSTVGGDAPNAGTFTAVMYGTTRTYVGSRNNLAFGKFGSFTGAGSSNTNNCLAMRFD